MLSFLCVVLAIFAQEAGEREPLDPSVYGLEVTFPDGWEPAPEENLQYRLAYYPKALEGERIHCRLILSRLKESDEPEGKPAWNLISEELVDSFRQAFPGGVFEEEPEMIRMGGRDAMQLRMKVKEADKSPREAVSTAFFHRGNVWRLDLVTSPEIFEEYRPVHGSVRDGIRFHSGVPPFLWGVVGLILGTILVIVIRARRKPEA